MSRLSNNESQSGWTDFAVITHGDLVAAAVTQIIGVLTAPAGSLLTAFGYRLDEPFDGGATTELTIQVGLNGGDADGLIIARSLHADATPVVYDANSGADINGAILEQHEVFNLTAVGIDALLTCTGGNVDALNAGKVTLFAHMKRCGEP